VVFKLFHIAAPSCLLQHFDGSQTAKKKTILGHDTGDNNNDFSIIEIRKKIQI